MGVNNVDMYYDTLIYETIMTFIYGTILS
jgi:hypothetical protein